MKKILESWKRKPAWQGPIRELIYLFVLFIAPPSPWDSRWIVYYKVDYVMLVKCSQQPGTSNKAVP